MIERTKEDRAQFKSDMGRIKTKCPPAGDKLAAVEHDNGFDLVTCLNDGTITMDAKFIMRVEGTDENTLASVTALIGRYNAHDAMYEALKAALPHLPHEANCNDISNSHVLHPVLSQARAALALAEGGK